MISLIIFSKNRPLQLDLCLTTVTLNFQASLEVTVIYKCDDEYLDAYQTLMKEHPKVQFWPEGKLLFNDVLMRLQSSSATYCCFLTDDCFLYKKSPLLCETSLETLFASPRIGYFSLRLGDNTSYRDIGNNTMQEQVHVTDKFHTKNKRGMICFDRTQHCYGGYWNYPLSVDGHIYRSTDMIEFAEELCYLQSLKQWKQTPNKFESVLQRFTNEMPPFAVCDEQSCVINSPNNRVQTTTDNANGQHHPISCEDMLMHFNEGKRIIPYKLELPEIICPHMEIDLLGALS